MEGVPKIDTFISLFSCLSQNILIHFVGFFFFPASVSLYDYFLLFAFHFCFHPKSFEVFKS